MLRITHLPVLLVPVFTLALVAGQAHAIDPARTVNTPPATTSAAVNPGSILPPNTVQPSATQPAAPRGRTRGTAPNPVPGTAVNPGSNFNPNPSLPFGQAGTFPGNLAPFAPGPNGLVNGTPTPTIAPPVTQQRPRWRLGVYSKDTEVGVQVLQVVSGSAADRAGLEANDLIVAVNGYQVGYVNGEYFDCGQEFERSADTEGRVGLLVQNNRNNQLVNLPLQLDSRLVKINGQIAYRGPINIPRTARVEVELRTLSLPGAPVIPLARQTISDIQQIPLPFQLEYDPSDIVSDRTYLIHAVVTDRGRTLYTTNEQYRVLQNGSRPQNIVVHVEAVNTPTGGNQAQLERDQIEQQIRQWYRDFVGREPYPYELPAFVSAVADRGQSMNDVQADILARDDVYTRAGRNDRDYLITLFRRIAGREPTQNELNQWLQEMQQHNGLRREVASELVRQFSIAR